LDRIEHSSPYTQVLILAPTRELGQQIAEQLNQFSKYQDKINVLAVYGGAPITNQMRALKNKTQHVIIATPGRLIDLIKRKAIKLDKLRILVLDEADEMLNMGFKEELDKILSYTPEEKMTWLFSATMPYDIRKIVRKYMSNPLEAKVDARNKVNTNIDHQYTLVKNADKSEALTRFIDIHRNMRGVVFCRTKRDTQELAEQLLKKGYKADALHGDLSQQQRDRVMKRFKAHALQVLIATDVAARGIDVNDLTHVFHYALPDDVSYYTHRSGRTARAGKDGISMAFVHAKEQHRIRRLEKTLGIFFTKMLIPNSTDIADVRIQNWCLEILEQKAKEKVDPKLLEKANLLFGNLSKEELIAKFIAAELDGLELGSDGDLNQDAIKDGGFRGRSNRKTGRNFGKKKHHHHHENKSRRGRSDRKKRW
jgi:ATP-dependent RNA helicase DeaD